jgi:hypothetical protein
MAVYRYKKEDLSPKKKVSRFPNKAWLVPAGGLLLFMLLVAVATVPQRQALSKKEQLATPASQEKRNTKQRSVEPAKDIEPNYKCYWEEGGSDYFITSDSRSCKERLASIEEQNKKPFYTAQQCKRAKEDLARAERDRRNYEAGGYATGAKLDGWAAEADYSVYRQEKERAERILYYCK